MRFELSSEVKKWADEKGLAFDPSKLGTFYHVSECLPSSEQAELEYTCNKKNLSERAETSAAMEYFDNFSIDDLKGFCTSISDRVILGAFMTEKNIDEIELFDNPEALEEAVQIEIKIRKDMEKKFPKRSPS